MSAVWFVVADGWGLAQEKMMAEKERSDGGEEDREIEGGKRNKQQGETDSNCSLSKMNVHVNEYIVFFTFVQIIHKIFMNTVFHV